MRKISDNNFFLMVVIASMTIGFIVFIHNMDQNMMTERSRLELSHKTDIIARDEAIISLTESNKTLSKKIDALELKVKNVQLETTKIKSATVTRGSETIRKNYATVESMKRDIERRTGKKVLSITYRKLEVTKYTAAECDKPPSHPQYGITASGAMASLGTVAAPRNVPFGSVIVIDHPKTSGILYKVTDRGGAIKDKGSMLCVDVYSNSKQDCIEFGRQKNVSGYVIVFKK